LEKRRRAVRRHAAPLTALVAAALLAGAAPACELPRDWRVLDGARHTLAYRTVPGTLAVGEHFLVEFALCAKGANVPDREHRVAASAHMPEHRHGMNYTPSVRALGSGRYRSEGWLFHMPGRWEFVFEMGGERFTDSVRLE
jgi:hypothetical protein